MRADDEIHFSEDFQHPLSPNRDHDHIIPDNTNNKLRSARIGFQEKESSQHNFNYEETKVEDSSVYIVRANEEPKFLADSQHASSPNRDRTISGSKLRRARIDSEATKLQAEFQEKESSRHNHYYYEETKVEAEFQEEEDSDTSSSRHDRIAARNTSQKSPCALLFFGLVKDFKDLALPAIQRNIIGPNPHCDIFLHTYDVDKVPENQRNFEVNGATIDPKEAYLLTDNVIIESLDLFERERRSFLEHSRKHYHRGSWGECCLSHDNMIKQWHSIAGVWKLMRQYEKKKLGPLMSNEDHYYQQIGLFRTDVYQVNSVDIFNSNATVPNFAHYWGYNDRLFYGSYRNAALWADRFGFSPIFEEKYMYTPEDDFQSDGYHSEYFLGTLMDHYNVSVDLQDVCVWRIRGGKRLQVTDCGEADGMKEFQSYDGLHGYKYAPEGYIRDKKLPRKWIWAGQWWTIWDEPVQDINVNVGYTLTSNATKVKSSPLLGTRTGPGAAILGMFRSGSSRLTGLLAEGYGFHVGNVDEKFELKPMKRQNDAFLWGQGLTSRHDMDRYSHEETWKHMQNNTLPTVCGAESLKQLEGPKNHHLPWVVNDPRLSITFETWLP